MSEWFWQEWQRVSWQWNPADTSWFSLTYHWFNIVEGIVWILLSGLVLRRFCRHRQTPVEVLYSLTFLSFGMTDFLEAWEQSTWLIGLKFVHVVLLFRLRIFVRALYADGRVY